MNNLKAKKKAVHDALSDIIDPDSISFLLDELVEYHATKLELHSQILPPHEVEKRRLSLIEARLLQSIFSR